MRLLLIVTIAAAITGAATSAPAPMSLRAVMARPADLTAAALRQAGGENAAVLMLDSRDAPEAIRAAIDRIRAAGKRLYYWIEVGRCPELADAHPEWMASLQGHQEWRRLFPKSPSPGPDEVVKNYPWVPVLYKEAFDAQLARVTRLLKDLPPAEGLFLNDLQAAPSACGCGNDQCRWTPDYGPIRTATRLPADAAAKFVEAVGKLPGPGKVIPVWTTECEEHDRAERCAGVGCFAGTCWYEYSSQLMPVAARCETLAALLPYRQIKRDDPRYGAEAGWVKAALSSFEKMPPLRRGQPVAAGRVIAVLQGWDVTAGQRAAQIQRSSEAGAAGYVLALTEIEQGWEPKLIRVPR